MFKKLLPLLPGKTKKIILISSQFPDEILKILDQIKYPVDTVILASLDVWRHFDARESIFNHPNLQNKNVFLQTLGYTNSKVNDRCWEISYPPWYWTRQKLSNQFIAKPRNLNYGFSCLNNTNNVHRTLLGYKLYNNNLINDMIFSQNIVAPAYALSRVSRDAIDLNLINFEEYRNLLPIRQDDPKDLELDSKLNFSNDHSITHNAYTQCYCNIVTESECEEYPYYNNINLPIVSEKSYKPLIAGQIPIMLAARGHIAYFKELGFEMMEDLLPVNYDIMNVIQKIESIVMIVSKGKEFIEDFYFTHLKEIQHNYELINSDKVEELILQKIKDVL